jgi:hypothetical protein
LGYVYVYWVSGSADVAAAAVFDGLAVIVAVLLVLLVAPWTERAKAKTRML